MKATEAILAGVFAGGGSGGGGGGYFQIEVDDDGVLNKTWQEIYDAVKAGMYCTIRYVDEGADWDTTLVETITNVYRDQSTYGVWTCQLCPTGSTSGFEPSPGLYEASAANDYPAWHEG